MSKCDIRITNLQCNYLKSPLGVENVPRLSWVLQSEEHGLEQKAYRIVAARTVEELQAQNWLWDSGIVESDSTVEVAYGGELVFSLPRIGKPNGLRTEYILWALVAQRMITQPPC